MEGVERYKVRLLPHNDGWEKEFIEVKEQILQVWKDNVVDIQHFGSTAIHGSYAKPILDVAVVLKSFQNMDMNALVSLGYSYCGLQQPDNDRYLYVLRGENQVSLRHIHCYEPNNIDFIKCIGFRDYLNTHADEAKEYSDLKRKLAEKYPDDRFAYTDEKLEFIQLIYSKL